MNLVKCFDAVSMVVEEATNQFAPLWGIDSHKYEILEQYCKAIDELASEFSGISYDVGVDEIEMTVQVVLECLDLTVASRKHRFYELAERSLSFGFSTSEDGNLNVKFVFPSVWERV